MRHERILAVDFGTKNVGLASSDQQGAMVRPLPSIPNLNRGDLIRRLRAVLRVHSIEAIAVGMPLHMDGSSGPAAERTRSFSKRLRNEFGLPVWEVDERLSTVEALEIWREMSPRQQRKYRTVDSLAAALILERFLEEP